jgi:trehalose/maltose hydrolase-like predicted phosphorylase
VARLLHWQQVNQSKVIKQADVLMLFFLFPDAFPKEIMERNFRYYAPMTDHGSSLSPGVHAAVAADLGLLEEANEYWKTSLNLDLQNLMKNTPLGLHLGCMGVTWQALLFHFLGMEFKEGRWLKRDKRVPFIPGGTEEILMRGLA